MGKKILGLDIRQDAVSAILVSSSIKGNRVEAHANVPGSERISDENAIENGIDLAIKTIAEKMDLTGSVCIASVPADQIIYRYIQVPFKDEKKIRQILPFELEPSLPLSPEDIVIDFQPLKLLDHRDRTDLITVSIEKSTLSSYLDILASYAIDPKSVTIGGYSLALYMSSLPDMPENWVLVDINKHNGSLYIAVSGEICFLRSFSMNFSDSSATTPLCASIEHSLNAFEDTFEIDLSLDCIFLTGSALIDSSIDGEIERILGLPVKRPDLLHHPDVPITARPESPIEPAQTDSALALALLDVSGIKGLNFRKGPFAYRKQWVENKKNLIISGIILALVLILGFFNIYIEMRGMEKQAARLDREIHDLFKTTFPDVKRIVDPLQQMRMKVKEAKKHAVNAGRSTGNVRMVDMLNAISTHVPKEIDVEFTQMLMSEDGILLSGNTDTFNSVDSIKRTIEQAEAFKNVTISSASTNRSGNRITFKLKVDL